ncbi:MAG: hypothetical protein EHM58_09525 [Ignavibacteriae bacterium]|nr:MAG: hypothetical protein EHM58_09525 [Ignavibacteriota bacterium]
MKKLSLFFFIFFLVITSIDCTSSKKVKGSNPQKWTYFKILADADDDPIFVRLQDDLGIDPKMERYTIIVNVESKDPGQQYLLFGDEDNPRRYSWTQISENVRTGLINWTGGSKENLK